MTILQFSSSWIRRFGRLGLGLVLAAGLGPGRVSGQPAAVWSSPVPLSPQGEFSWFPDIAADLTGQLHAVWASGARAGRVTYDAVMYSTSADGTVWSSPNDIAVVSQGPSGESAATRPTLLVDAANTLHIAYTDYFHIFYSQAWPEQAESAQGWTPVRDLGTGNPVYFSRILTDHQGRLHLLFTENVYSRACPQCYHVFYRWSDDNGLTWSLPVDISLSLAGSAKVQLVIDAEDNLYAVWESGRGGSYGGLEMESRVQFAASYNRGQSWTTPVDPSPPLFSSENTESATPAAAPTPVPRVILKNITIGLDGRGQLVLAWLGLPEDLVYSQVSADGGRTWSAPAPIPGVWGGQTVYNTRLDDYAMTTDSAGQVHLLFVGRLVESDKTLHVLHNSWDGATWSPPESLASYVGDVPEWPRLTTRLGNTLHAVWFVRNVDAVFGSDAASARYQVWYAQRPLEVPLVEPTILPRPTEVLATPTPAGMVTTPLPSPTVRPVLPAVVQPQDPYNENDYILIAAVSLTPVLLLIGVAWGIMRLRRR